MLRKNLLLLSLFMAGLVFTSCGDKPKAAPPPEISFNITDASAIAGKEVDPDRSAFGARDADDVNNTAVVKIMEDGTLKSAMNCKVYSIYGFTPEEQKKRTKWAKLTDVFLPPKDSGCSDVYLLFDGETSFPTEYQDNPGHIGFWTLSQLICIHGDNTWTDILYDSPWGQDLVFMETKKCIQIASDGSLYVLFRDAFCGEFYLRKYDATTKKVSELCRFGKKAPLISDTESWTPEEWEKSRIYIKKIRISKDGKWAYIEIEQPERVYLHVVSTDDPSNFKDIELNEGAEPGCFLPAWDYDEESDQIYYLKPNNDDFENAFANDVWKANCNGSKCEFYKRFFTEQFCNALMVVDKDTVWARYDDSNLNYDQIICFKNIATDKVTASFTLPYLQNTGFYCEDEDYIIKDNAIYLCYGAFGDYQNEYYDMNEIIRVSVTDGSVIDYSDMLTEKYHIMVIGWSVGDSKLYITGKSNGQPANYAINLDGTGTPQRIGEGQIFTCIGGLK